MDCGMKGGRRSLEQAEISYEMRFRSIPTVAASQHGIIE